MPSAKSPKGIVTLKLYVAEEAKEKNEMAKVPVLIQKLISGVCYARLIEPTMVFLSFLIKACLKGEGRPKYPQLD